MKSVMTEISRFVIFFKHTSVVKFCYYSNCDGKLFGRSKNLAVCFVRFITILRIARCVVATLTLAFAVFAERFVGARTIAQYAVPA